MTLLFSFLVLLLHCWQHYTGAPEWRADLYIAVPVVQLIGVLLLVYRYWWPQTKGDLLLFLAGNLLVFGNILLFYQGLHFWCCVNLAVIGLRVIIASMWLLGLLGISLLLITLKKNTLRWHRLAPRWLFAGMGSLLAIMTIESVAAFVEPAPSARVVFPDLQKHQDDTLTIAALGGSSMKGFPYPPGFGMTEVAVEQLRKSQPATDVELHNLAITGQNLAQAITQMNKLSHAPDVIVVYSGHNEFFHDLEEMSTSRRIKVAAVDRLFRWSPTFRVVHPILAQYQLGAAPKDDASSMFRAAICTEEMSRVRLARFGNHLDRLVEWANQRDVRLLFCVPAKDLVTFEPNFCVADALTEADKAHITSGVVEIRALQRDGKHQEAVESAKRLLSEFPTVPEFHFRMAQSLLLLSQPAASEQHFIKATELDQLATRIRPDYEAQIRDAAGKGNVPLLDAPAILRQYASMGVSGDDLFLDGVHPNIVATYILGMHIAQILDSNIKDSDRIEFAQMMDLLQMNAEKLQAAYAESVKVLRHYSGFRGWDPADRLQRAGFYRDLAQGMQRGRIQPGEQGAESLDSSVPLPTLSGKDRN